MSPWNRWSDEETANPTAVKAALCARHRSSPNRAFPRELAPIQVLRQKETMKKPVTR